MTHQEISIEKYGRAGNLKLVERASRAPAAGEVVIDVAYSGVNFADIQMRLGFYPDAPPRPFVPGYEVAGWYAMLAPAKTPSAIVNQLSQAVARVVQQPETRDKLVNGIGLEPVGSTPQVLDAQIQKELKKWAEVIKRLGIEPEAL